MTRMTVVLFLSLLLLAVLQTEASGACEGIDLDSWTGTGVIIDVHRNGEPDPCASIDVKGEELNLWFAEICHLELDKYQVESFLTRVVSDTLGPEACRNIDDPEPIRGFAGYCDRGEKYTPLLTDNAELVRIDSGSLPCRFFSRISQRVVSMQQFFLLSTEHEQVCVDKQTNCEEVPRVRIYAVSAGRVFMFAASYVGEIFELPHVDVDNGLPVYMKTLNTNPRVFDIMNFFDKSESDSLVAKALAEESETHRMKRSTTGTGENTKFNKRTSENAFDTHGIIALKIKRRCMQALGFDVYMEGHTDGLQILRYNVTNAYVQHMDYMKDVTGRSKYNFESQYVGGNRFATMLLYMTDFEEGEGGETVFSESWPVDIPEEERKNMSAALEELRATGDASMLEEGSWEEKMVATCRSKFSVRPHSARAVLFYSQFPNGREDPKSKHGGCPVLHPDKPKMAANLWSWSVPREGFPGAPMKEGYVEKKQHASLPKQIKATFYNLGTDPKFEEAELFYDESGYWGKIGFGEEPLIAYTFAGHKYVLMQYPI